MKGERLKEMRHHPILSKHEYQYTANSTAAVELTIDIRFIKSGQVVQAIVHLFA